MKLICMFLTVLLLAACATAGLSLNRQMTDLTDELSVQGRVRVVDATVEKSVRIQKVIDVGQNGPKLQVFICNIKGRPIALEYALKWFNRGALLDGVNQDWLPLMIQANDCAVVQAAAPQSEADRFELLLKESVD